MKKKLLAALCAAVLGICSLGTATAFAEEATYQKGDITMDGKVDVDDVMLMLRLYTFTFMWYDSYKNGRIDIDTLYSYVGVTREQAEIGNIDGLGIYYSYDTKTKTVKYYDLTYPMPVDCNDALYLLHYISLKQVDIDITIDDVIQSYGYQSHLKRVEIVNQILEEAGAK